MSTLMTERRRPPDNEDGQESLFGGEAFAAGPPAPTSWEREHAPPAHSRRDAPLEASAHLPLDVDSDAPAFAAETPGVEDGADVAFARDDLEAPPAFEARVVSPSDDEARFRAERAPVVDERAGFDGREPFDERAGFDAYPLDERAPFDESQYLTGYEAGPSAEDLAAYDFALGAVPTEVPAHDAGEELAELERATTVPAVEHKPRAPLAGPTLDDVMSRAWEGLVTGLPAACPVCDGELQPSFAGVVRGTCSSCGTTIE
jgi:hypothetical protein